MPRISLRRFIIASVILHIIAFSIWGFVWKPRAIVTQPQLINLGVVGSHKDRVAGTGGVGETYKKVAPELEKKVIKPASMKNQENKTINKQEVKNQPSKPVTEPSRVNGSYSASNEQKGVISGGLTVGIESFMDGNDIGYDDSMLGDGEPGKGIEVGYPDYKINPKPNYPMIARRNGYEGVVLLRVWVLESGNVGKIEIEKSSGYEMLDNSALKAVKEWVFTPGKRNGAPIPSWVTVPIKFQLRSG